MPYHLRVVIVALAAFGPASCEPGKVPARRPAPPMPDEPAPDAPELPERPGGEPDLALDHAADDAANDAPLGDASAELGCGDLAGVAINRAAANDDECYWLAAQGGITCRRCDAAAEDPCDTNPEKVAQCP